ncbi:MAG: hypothetical protein PVSMB1_04970 [Gemmatimonadaceae bacterium]
MEANMEISKEVKAHVAMAIGNKYWRSVAENEARGFGKTKAERDAISKYVREQFDAAGAGLNGRWQGK